MQTKLSESGETVVYLFVLHGRKSVTPPFPHNPVRYVFDDLHHIRKDKKNKSKKATWFCYVHDHHAFFHHVYDTAASQTQKWVPCLLVPVQVRCLVTAGHMPHVQARRRGMEVVHTNSQVDGHA